MKPSRLLAMRVRAALTVACLTVICIGPVAAQEPPRVPEVSAPWNDRVIWGRSGTSHQRNSYYWLEGVVGQSNYARIVQDARARVREGKFDEAIRLFEQAARSEPKDAPYDELGDALASVNRLDEAVDAYRVLIYGGMATETVSAAEQNPSARKPLDWRGNWSATLMRYFLLLLRVKREEEAFLVYQWGIAALNRDEEKKVFAINLDTKTWKQKKSLLMASAHTIIGKTDIISRTPDWPKLTALARYREALAIQPDYGPALLYMGQLYQDIGRSYDPAYTEPGQIMLDSARRAASPGVRQSARDLLNGIPH